VAHRAVQLARTDLKFSGWEQYSLGCLCVKTVSSISHQGLVASFDQLMSAYSNYSLRNILATNKRYLVNGIPYNKGTWWTLISREHFDKGTAH